YLKGDKSGGPAIETASSVEASHGNRRDIPLRVRLTCHPQASAAARGVRLHASERARLVSRLDCPGGSRSAYPRQEPLPGQGALGCELGTVLAGMEYYRAGATGAGESSAALVHESGMLGLWGAGVHTSLSVRTHLCPRCGLLDRDQHAALCIRQAGLAQASRQGI